MYDRQTFTLWGNLTGEPVVGKMATSDQRLRVLPMTITTWKDWRTKHPSTKVLRLDSSFGEKWNYRYEPGLADRAREGVRFPVWQKSTMLKEREEVYAVRLNNHAKAFAMESLLSKSIVNDRIGNTPVVVLVDQETGAVRIYERTSHTFSRKMKSLQDQVGREWKVEEDFIENGDERLARIPGHLSLWFAWYGFFPHTEIYK